MPTALISGHAGFVGFHLSKKLLASGWQVVGIDNLTSYYSVKLKRRRLELLGNHEKLTSILGGIEESNALLNIFEQHRPSIVVHLAAQAGVRHSIENPHDYFESNLRGSFELLEAARQFRPKHILMASSSSVYGASTSFPYSETQNCNTPVSFYAATKKSTELLAHSYASVHQIPMTMMRFFTVYGPWGRPDMAYMKFIRAALAEQPIDVYNNGNMKRDFTYIDDVIEAVTRLAEIIPLPSKERSGLEPIANDSLSSVAPFRVVNVGHGNPIQLLDFVRALEDALGKRIKQNMRPIMQGDVRTTWSDTRLLQQLTNFQPKIPINEGVERLVSWYLNEYTWDD